MAPGTESKMPRTKYTVHFLPGRGTRAVCQHETHETSSKTMSPPLPAREARVGYGHDPSTEGERGTEGLTDCQRTLSIQRGCAQTVETSDGRLNLSIGPESSPDAVR